MWTSAIVKRNVFAHGPPQMRLVENEQCIQTFIAGRSDPAFCNGRIAKDKFCISRWVELPKAPLRNKVSAAQGVGYPGNIAGQTNQEKHRESSQPPLADPTPAERASGRLVPLGQSVSGSVELGKPSVPAENE